MAAEFLFKSSRRELSYQTAFPAGNICCEYTALRKCVKRQIENRVRKFASDVFSLTFYGRFYESCDFFRLKI